MNVKAKVFTLNTLKTLAMPTVIILLFALITGGRSLNGNMLRISLQQSVIPIFISMALVINMILGLLDFSSGAVVLASSIIGGNLMKLTGTGLPGLVLFCMVTSVALTSLTGFLNNKLRVPTLVLTLGLLLTYEALPRVIFSNGVTISTKYSILAIPPWIFIMLAVVFVAFYILYNLTTYGHNLRALGGSEDIAKAAGLNISRIKQINFTISGIFLGAASAVYLSSSAQITNVASFGSMGMMFNAFMGVFLGFFLIRYCNIAIGVVVGTFTMSSLINDFVAAGMAQTSRDIITGVFLLILLGVSANQGRFRQWRIDRERVRQHEAKNANELAH